MRGSRRTSRSSRPAHNLCRKNPGCTLDVPPRYGTRFRHVQVQRPHRGCGCELRPRKACCTRSSPAKRPSRSPPGRPHRRGGAPAAAGKRGRSGQEAAALPLSPPSTQAAHRAQCMSWSKNQTPTARPHNLARTASSHPRPAAGAPLVEAARGWRALPRALIADPHSPAPPPLAARPARPAHATLRRAQPRGLPGCPALGSSLRWPRPAGAAPPRSSLGPPPAASCRPPRAVASCCWRC
mmetsp:Transcript_141202/g.393514  ORF Transcript_141202/g.393514 Transcript_141202/m.393514 type:complete len:239 (-) Transcript_141202:313-1029(-)